MTTIQRRRSGERRSMADVLMVWFWCHDSICNVWWKRFNKWRFFDGVLLNDASLKTALYLTMTTFVWRHGDSVQKPKYWGVMSWCQYAMFVVSDQLRLLNDTLRQMPMLHWRLRSNKRWRRLGNDDTVYNIWLNDAASSSDVWTTVRTRHMCR